MATQKQQQQQQQQASTSAGPLVIGAGLMRTGTNSQKKALEILLGGRCYHMEVIMKEKKSHLQLWHRAATEGLTKELAAEIFDGFNSCTDFPAAHFYRELSQIYPNAKFVLSIRDPKRWADSVRATIQQGFTAMEKMLPPTRWLFGLSYFLPLHDVIFERRLGFRFDMSDGDMALAFNRHTESVVQAIPKDRLLVFRVADGWEPLCKFLDLPVPDESFPNVNDTASFQRMAGSIATVGALTNLALCSAVGAVLWFGARRCLEKWG